jgi:hypothetical protein
MKGNIYPDVLELFAFLQTKDGKIEKETLIVFQQDRPLPYFSNEVQDILNARFPNQWIVRNELIT